MKIEHDFDGKIMIKRVSKQIKSKTATHHQIFSVNYHINQLIKDGEWKGTCVMPVMEPWQLFETIQDTYDLDDNVVFSLVLTYRTFSSTGTKTKKVVHLDRSSKLKLDTIDIHTKKGGTTRKINLDDLTLHVRSE